MKIGTRVYSTLENYVGFGVVVADAYGCEGDDVSVKLDGKTNGAGGYWYLDPEKVTEVEFAVGDRVSVTTGDSFDGARGYVTEIQPFDTCIDYLVKIDGRRYPVSFEQDELGPETPVVRRRLTITRNLETSGMSGSCGANYSDRTEVVEGEFDFTVEEIDPHKYVQVKTNQYSRLTYIDPSGTLAVGDRVLVPLGYLDRESLGTVIDLGRGEYTGPCKSVGARLAVEALA